MVLLLGAERPQPMGNPSQARNTPEELQPTGGLCWGRNTKEPKDRSHHVKLQQLLGVWQQKSLNTE